MPVIMAPPLIRRAATYEEEIMKTFITLSLLNFVSFSVKIKYSEIKTAVPKNSEMSDGKMRLESVG